MRDSLTKSTEKVLRRRVIREDWTICWCDLSVWCWSLMLIDSLLLLTEWRYGERNAMSEIAEQCLDSFYLGDISDCTPPHLCFLHGQTGQCVDMGGKGRDLELYPAFLLQTPLFSGQVSSHSPYNFVSVCACVCACVHVRMRLFNSEMCPAGRIHLNNVAGLDRCSQRIKTWQQAFHDSV